LTEKEICVCSIVKCYSKKELQKLQKQKVDIVNLNEIDENFDFEIISHISVVQIWDSDLRKLNPENIYKYAKNLKVFKLIDTQISNEFDFSKIDSLEELETIHQNKIKFNNCLNLRSIVLRKTQNIPIDFSGLPNIETIEIIQGKVKEILNIETCKKLKALTIYNSRFEKKFELEKLLKLPEIEYLQFSNYKDEISLELFNRINSLRCLILENCINVNSENIIIDNLIFKTRIIGKSNIEKDKKRIMENISNNCSYGYFLSNRYLDRQTKK